MALDCLIERLRDLSKQYHRKFWKQVLEWSSGTLMTFSWVPSLQFSDPDKSIEKASLVPIQENLKLELYYFNEC